MYKLFVFTLFFSMTVAAQTVPPLTNQKNTQEKEKKPVEEAQADDAMSIERSSEMNTFLMNVQEIQEELNTIALSTKRKSLTKNEAQQLEVRLNKLKAINKQSFEYNLLNYQVGNYDFSRIENLKAAERLQPNNISVLMEFSAYFYINNDGVELKKYLNKLSNQHVFSKDLQIYAENTLQSLPLNTVLITHGKKDTYPLLIQQKIKNNRTDVEIISLDHLQSMEYRKRLKKLGFAFPKNDFIDTQFFGEFVQLNKRKNIVVAASVPRAYLSKGGSTMKSIGLGIAYHIFDAAENQKIYESSMKTLIAKHISQSEEKQLLGNYLPFLFSVRNSYITNNDVKNTDEIEVLILKIAQLSNKYQQVKSLLNK